MGETMSRISMTEEYMMSESIRLKNIMIITCTIFFFESQGSHGKKLL